MRALEAARRDVAAAAGVQWVVAVCLARVGQRRGAARGGHQLALARRVLGWSEVWARGHGAAADARTARAEVRWLDSEEVARRARQGVGGPVRPGLGGVGWPVRPGLNVVGWTMRSSARWLFARR